MYSNSNNPSEIENIEGTVDDVIYKNEANGYAVVDILTKKEMVTAVGTLSMVSAGEKLSLSGVYIDSAKYGKQFKVLAFERKPPETKEEILSFLSSGAVKGITKPLAKKIVERFGASSLAIIDRDPIKLTEIDGISAQKAAIIAADFRRNTGMNKTIEFLSEFGISTQIAVNIWNKYDNSSVQMIKDNPYLLCEEGVPFDAADNIAGRLDLPQAGENRVRAAVIYILRENADGGHTCLPRKKLIAAAANEYDISADNAEIVIDNCVSSGVLKSLGEDVDKSRIYLPEYHTAETYIAVRIAQMLTDTQANPAKNTDKTPDIDAEIAAIEWTRGISYAPSQIDAIKACLSGNLFILTGGPGTGKTTTLGAIIELCKKRKLTITLAAPTGRAAKRIAELTGENAKTIHRLLEVDVTKDNLLTFAKNDDNPLKFDVVIVDETSMVDVLLFEALLRAVKPGGRLMLIGDANQLPSVGAGNVLRDLMATGIIPFTELNEIFRQAAESLIVTNAHKIVRGEWPELNVKSKDFFFMPVSNEQAAGLTVDLVGNRLPKAYGLDPKTDIQVLSPTKQGQAGSKELNRLLQLALNPASKAKSKKEIKYFDTVFREGDKVMQITNDYDIEWKRAGEKGRGIFNGDIGFITEIRPQQGIILADFDGRVATYPPQSVKNLDLAYAITVHKSQGSEYNAVVLPVADVSPRLLYRNLLYTAVTRAKNLLIIIGQSSVVYTMVENDRRTNRYSNLKPLIVAMEKKLRELKT
jgi:exodeoxyribonuclease V alpha subunit